MQRQQELTCREGVPSPRSSASAGFGSCRRPADALLSSFTLLVLGALLLLRLDIFQTRWFNPDEFEHLHAAWCRTQGLLPYRDFFEHHTPWFYFMLQPVVSGAERSFDPAAHALRAARGISLCLTAAALGATVWLGKVWAGWFTGLTAAVFLAGIPMFLDKTIEIRPDVPALMLWICCLACLAVGVKRAIGANGEEAASNTQHRTSNIQHRTEACGPRNSWSLGAPILHPEAKPFLLAGLCLGGALMFTQKLLFTLPGLGVALLGWVLFAGPKGRTSRRLALTGWFLIGLLVPVVATWVWFAAQGGGRAFIWNNFLLNARWRAAELREPWLHQIAVDNWPTLLLALGGLVILCCDAIRRKAPDWTGVLFVASAAGLLLGLLIIPVAFAQYYLPLLVPLALFAGRCFAVFSERLPALLRWIYVPVALLLLQIWPVEHALRSRYWSNSGQLAALEFVMQQAAPRDIVMDGWRGLGVFRPHAWYYYFLHPEVRGMLPPKDLERFLEDLESGKIKPRLVAMDNNLRALSPRFVAFVKRYYEPADHDIWVRKSK